MPTKVRRVVSGLSGAGRSTVIFDSEAPNQIELPDVPGLAATFLWMTHGAPADNRGGADAATGPLVFPPKPRGSCFYVFEYPPLSRFDDPDQRERARLGGRSPEDGQGAQRAHPGMHRTATLEYIVMISGEITVLLEEGEVTLKAGDVFIDRGVFHAWENRGEQPAVFASIALDAEPLPT